MLLPVDTIRSPIEVTQDNKQDDATYAGVEGHCRHRHSRKFVLSGSIHRAERTSAQTHNWTPNGAQQRLGTCRSFR